MNTAERIKKLRTEKKWTQSYLAQKIGLSQQTIYMLENNLMQASLSSARKIADAFEVETDWLLHGTPPKHVHLLPLLNWAEIDAPKTEKSEVVFHIPVSKDLCSSESYFLKINNDAMIADSSTGQGFPPEDMIGVDPTVTPKNGQYVIAQLKKKELPIFRQYVEDAEIYLKALNPVYPIIKVTTATKIKGVVFMRLRYV